MAKNFYPAWFVAARNVFLFSRIQSSSATTTEDSVSVVSTFALGSSFIVYHLNVRCTGDESRLNEIPG